MAILHTEVPLNLEMLSLTFSRGIFQDFGMSNARTIAPRVCSFGSFLNEAGCPNANAYKLREPWDRLGVSTFYAIMKSNKRFRSFIY